MSEGMMFMIVLVGCAAGAGMMFVDKVTLYLYCQAQKAGLFANEERYGAYISALLAGMFQAIVALLVVIVPFVLVFRLIKDFSEPLNLPPWFISYGSLSVVMGMVIGVVLRRKLTSKTY